MFFHRFVATTSMLLAVSLPASAAVLDISITFDDYPVDISWTVEDPFGANFGAGGGYGKALAGQTVNALIDLSAGEYEFGISDSYGDGLCCSEGEGGYTLSLDNTVFYTSSGDFGTGESVKFTVPRISAVPLPAGGLLLLSGLAACVGLQRRKRLV